MRLEVTRRTDLATRAMIVLSRQDRMLKGAELAERLETSSGFLAQAMGPLVSSRWVRSEPGPSGGYVLVADLADVSVLDVIEAVEGPTETNECVLEDRSCLTGGPCALHEPWSRARAELLGELGATALSTLTEGIGPP